MTHKKKLRKLMFNNKDLIYFKHDANLKELMPGFSYVFKKPTTSDYDIRSNQREQNGIDEHINN